MGLDKIEIGARIRMIREHMYNENRQNFAERCNLSENHLGKLERGEIMVSVITLDKICQSSGVSSDYILYGKKANNHLSTRTTLNTLLDNSSKEELKLYFKFISLIKNFSTTEK